MHFVGTCWRHLDENNMHSQKDKWVLVRGTSMKIWVLVRSTSMKKCIVGTCQKHHDENMYLQYNYVFMEK